MTRRRLIRFVLGSGAVLAMCGASPDGVAAARKPVTHTVTIDGSRFEPETLSVVARRHGGVGQQGPRGPHRDLETRSIRFGPHRARQVVEIQTQARRRFRLHLHVSPDDERNASRQVITSATLPASLSTSASTRVSVTLPARFLADRHVFEDRRPLAEALRDFGHGDLSIDRVRSPFDYGIQPRRPADRKTDEALNAGRDRQPAHHGLLVRPSAEDDAPDCRAAAAPGGFDDPLALIAPIEPLDFPDIRLDPGVLKRADCVDHERRTHSRSYAAGCRPDASS